MNTTTAAPSLTPDIALAYSAMISMALVPIYFGSFLSLTKATEEVTKKDAYMFPLVGSGVLFGLYVLFRMFSKDYVNMLLTLYFLIFGYYSLVETLAPIVKSIIPSLDQTKKNKINYRVPWDYAKQHTLEFNYADIFAWVISGCCLVWYYLTKNWIANNLLGLSFSIQGVSLISLGSYQVGCILLLGLFFYDIFWVFGTDVMVTVAKSFDAPIKLIFPKSLFASEYAYSMLGLGDIVIPGIFVALLLRYDAHRAFPHMTKPKDKKKLSKLSFPTPYFNATFFGYAAGLISTMVIMHTFQAAQPALLYLVPACIGFSIGQSLYLNDFNGLFNWGEQKEENNDKTTTKKNGNNQKNTNTNANKNNANTTTNKNNNAAGVNTNKNNTNTNTNVNTNKNNNANTTTNKNNNAAGVNTNKNNNVANANKNNNTTNANKNNNAANANKNNNATNTNKNNNAANANKNNNAASANTKKNTNKK